MFWPPDRTHRILPVSLSREGIPASLRASLEDIDELASLADVLRALQCQPGCFAGGSVAHAALARSAELLKRTAKQLPGPEAEVIALRAQGLSGNGGENAAIRQAQIQERDLVLLCGPMTTWQRKSSLTYYGFAASVPLPPSNLLIARADSLLPDVQAYLADMLGQPELVARQAYRFLVTNLVNCGGEPNRFPKHFAYFLPEDEGIKRAKVCKTVVYANVYDARFESISRRLAQLGLDPAIDVSAGQAMTLLLLWFRGHDVGHRFRLPNSAFRELGQLGRDTSIALQEALADVVGYLAVSGGPWYRGFGIDLASCGFVFLAELLHYLERGAQYFPDSEAADLELSYLINGGYAELSAAGQVLWDPQTLHDGMLALGRELVVSILGNDTCHAAQMVATHLANDREPMSSWRPRFHHYASDVPTSLAYESFEHNDQLQGEQLWQRH